MSYDIVVKGGLVVSATASSSPTSRSRASVSLPSATASRRARASSTRSGLYVIPGAIDGHVHLQRPDLPAVRDAHRGHVRDGYARRRVRRRDDRVDFAQPAVGQPLLEELDRRLADADGEAVIDYALAPERARPGPRPGRQEIPEVFARGVPSFKLYMAYEGYRIPDEAIFRAMLAVAARAAASRCSTPRTTT